MYGARRVERRERSPVTYFCCGRATRCPGLLAKTIYFNDSKQSPPVDSSSSIAGRLDLPTGASGSVTTGADSAMGADHAERLSPSRIRIKTRPLALKQSAR